MNPSPVKAGSPTETNQLKKEIERIARNGNLDLKGADTQEVTVHFLINARQELIVFETSGDNEEACARVKEALNYKQVRYKQARQLTPYEISIRFVNRST
jgi:hypothetical protein